MFSGNLKNELIFFLRVIRSILGLSIPPRPRDSFLLLFLLINNLPPPKIEKIEITLSTN